MSLLAELKRRNVIRVAAAYAVLSWLVLQIGDVMIDSLDLSGDYSKFIIILLALGFIPVLVFSWVFEMTPEGIKKESEIDREASVTGHTAKKLDYITIGMVIAGVIFSFGSATKAARPIKGRRGQFAGVRADFRRKLGSDPTIAKGLRGSGQLHRRAAIP